MFVNQREKLTLDQESLRAFFHAPLQLIETTVVVAVMKTTMTAAAATTTTSLFR